MIYIKMYRVEKIKKLFYLHFQIFYNTYLVPLAIHKHKLNLKFKEYYNMNMETVVDLIS